MGTLNILCVGIIGASHLCSLALSKHEHLDSSGSISIDKAEERLSIGFLFSGQDLKLINKKVEAVT